MPGEQLSWDDVNVQAEGVTATDVKNAQSSGGNPLGKFLVTVVESTPRERKFADYTCYEANLKMEIDQVIGLGEGESFEEVPADDEETQATYEGRPIFDGITLHHDMEKDGFRKRRVLVASRLGLISEDGGELGAKAWGSDIIGKQCIVTTETNHYKDKNGNEKSRVQIGFNGYERAEVEEDSYEDI